MRDSSLLGGGSLPSVGLSLLDCGCCFCLSLMAKTEDSLDLIYVYTEGNLKDTIASLNGLNNRLTTAIGFAGVLLRFALDVHQAQIRWGIVAAVTGCLIISVAGLLAKASGHLVNPEILIRDLWYKPKDCKKQILSNWLETLNQLDAKRLWKARCLNIAGGCLIVSIFLLAVAVVIG